MKTAYELAMERLNKTAPATKLTGAQKKQLAELDSKYAAKIAEREIALRDEITKAAAAGDAEKAGTAPATTGQRTKKTSGRIGGEKGTGAARQGVVSILANVSGAGALMPDACVGCHFLIWLLGAS